METAWEIRNGPRWSSGGPVMSGEDFKEKGAVGAVKDAVADAGDILIDGVSGRCGKRGRRGNHLRKHKATDTDKETDKATDTETDMDRITERIWKD